jgi:hypothetical protein
MCNNLSESDYKKCESLSCTIKAGIAADANMFVNKIIAAPLAKCCSSLLTTSNGLQVNLYSGEGILESVSVVLNCIEELFILFAGSVQRSHAKNAVPVDITRMKYLRLSCDADIRYIADVTCGDILMNILQQNIFEMIAMIGLHFLMSPDAKLVAGISDIGRDANESALSLGSRLLMRVSKFYQHIIININSIYRSSNSYIDESIKIAFPLKRETQLVDELEVKANTVFNLAVQSRKILDGSYFHILTSVSMLYSGDETYSRNCSSRDSMLSSSYGDITSVVHDITCVAENHWSPFISRLFEPLLLELTSEDGKGSSKVLCSKDNILWANRCCNVLSLRLTPSMRGRY